MKTLPVPLALVAVLVLGAAGCATGDDAIRAAEPREQPEYRTGSNLPTRAPKPKTQEERERAAAEAEQARRDAEKILRPGS